MKSRRFGSSRSLRAAALFALLPLALLPVIAASPAAASFSSCVAGLQEAAARAGVSRSVASRALDIAQPDEKVLRLSEVQPEFKTPIWDYLGFLVDEQRVADGRAMMRQYDQILRAAERRFGGQTQFIPSTYQRLAVDFDGDGRRDLVRSVADALGSTANYLKRSGWQPGDPWMIEVTVPRGYDGPTGRGNKSSLSSWAQRNVLRADGAQLSAGAPVVYKEAGLLLPAGPPGPGFLVFRNFDAIYAYNQAESYALAISHLADRLAGHPPLRTPWPTDDPGLTRAERRHLQQLLLANGYNIGEADGKIGPATRAAIADAERRFARGHTPAALC
jgi:membrane-bound lytic murein transglycosylase B